MYAKYLKRPIDFCLSLFALIVLSPVLLILTVVGAIKMKGNPFFSQPRPGKDEKIFNLIKFRSMTCETDENGKLLPDDVRLTKYGKALRETSLDELPELLNILKGDMSIIGPRPLLVRDMVFMTDEQRRRHTVRPGLSGLAQVNGRNALEWKNKLNYDLQYLENITFFGDIKIIFQTVYKVIKHEDISEEGMETGEDFGDYLLRIGDVTQAEYDEKQEESKILLNIR